LTPATGNGPNKSFRRLPNPVELAALIAGIWVRGTIEGMQSGWEPASAASGSALVGALDWLRNLLLGSSMTIIAVLAVAAVGFLTLSGRLPARRAARVVLGCFILFSAGAIANGLVASLNSGSRYDVAMGPVSGPSYTPSTPPDEPYDPYAGAAVPSRKAGDLVESR